MIRAYYTATNGAVSNQNYLDVISNNMANIQTEGYKRAKGEFSDLLYTNIRGQQGEDTDLKAGSGSRLGKIDVVFSQGPLYATGKDTDYAIEGDGFFGVQFDDDTYYTRGGGFDKINMDGEVYLMYQGGYVLDENEEPILVNSGIENEEEQEEGPVKIGTYVFQNNSDLERIGNNLFRLANEDAEYDLSENSNVLKGYLEQSSVEVSDEMIKMLQTQKAFQLNSKVIQTADEIEQTINSLRG